MRLFYELLCKKLHVVRVKNKYDQSGPTAESGNPSILLNVGVQTPFGEYIGEVQLILQAYLVAKHVQHKSYEARTRAESGGQYGFAFRLSPKPFWIALGK